MFRHFLPTLLLLQQVGCHGAPAADAAARGQGRANRADPTSDAGTSPSSLPEASTTDVALSPVSPSSDGSTADAEVAGATPSEGPTPAAPWPPDRPGVVPRACCDALQTAVCAAPDPRCWQLAQAAHGCYELFRRGDAKVSTLATLRKALNLMPLPAACR